MVAFEDGHGPARPVETLDAGHDGPSLDIAGIGYRGDLTGRSVERSRKRSVLDAAAGARSRRLSLSDTRRSYAVDLPRRGTAVAALHGRPWMPIPITSRPM